MKNFLLVFLNVLIIVSFVSCSTAGLDVQEKDGYEKNILVDKSYAQLRNDIIVLNSNLSQQETRGFLSRLFNRVLSVFVSDVWGAVKGVFSGDNVWQSAQGSSLNTAKRQGFITGVDCINELCKAPRKVVCYEDTLVTSFIQPKEVALDNLVLVQDSSLTTANDSIGYYHNLVIYNTLVDNNSINYWKSVSDEACVLMLNEEIINTIPISSYSDVNVSDETIEFCSFISEEAAKCEDYRTLMSVFDEKYPELGNITDVMSLYFEGMELVTTDEEWEAYCKNLIDLISNSELAERDKETLKAGVAVGYASSKLWKCEE